MTRAYGKTDFWLRNLPRTAVLCEGRLAVFTNDKRAIKEIEAMGLTNVVVNPKLENGGSFKVVKYAHP